MMNDECEIIKYDGSCLKSGRIMIEEEKRGMIVS